LVNNYASFKPESTTTTTMKRIRAMRKRFHPDLRTHPRRTSSSRATACASTSLALLTPVSTFFEDIATLPTPPGDNIIPLYSARSDALALALKLVAAAHFSPSPPHLPWPSRQTLKHLSIIVDAYDLPMIPEALIDATHLDPLVSASVCYERVIWAAAEDVPGLYTIIRHTALHRLQDQDKWIVNALSKFPYAMAHLKTCRRELEKIDRRCHQGLRYPAGADGVPILFLHRRDPPLLSLGWVPSPIRRVRYGQEGWPLEQGRD
jgi:hypothetical protein